MSAFSFRLSEELSFRGVGAADDAEIPFLRQPVVMTRGLPQLA